MTIFDFLNDDILFLFINTKYHEYEKSKVTSFETRNYRNSVYRKATYPHSETLQIITVEDVTHICKSLRGNQSYFA